MGTVLIERDQLGYRQTCPTRVFETERLPRSNVRLPFNPFLVHKSAQNQALSSGSSLYLERVKKRRRSSG
jgi:hypothetical protein